MVSLKMFNGYVDQAKKSFLSMFILEVIYWTLKILLKG